MALKDACMEYARKLSSIVSREASECDCTLLSGGIDTTFVVLSHPGKTRLTAITVDLSDPDAYHARLVASRRGLRRILRSPELKGYSSGGLRGHKNALLHRTTLTGSAV